MCCNWIQTLSFQALSDTKSLVNVQHYFSQICRYAQFQQNSNDLWGESGSLQQQWLYLKQEKPKIQHSEDQRRYRSSVTVMLLVKEDTKLVAGTFIYLLMPVSISVLQFKVRHFWKTHYIPHLGEPSLSCAVWLFPWSPWKTSRPPWNVKGSLTEKSRREARGGNQAKLLSLQRSVQKWNRYSPDSPWLPHVLVKLVA